MDYNPSYGRAWISGDWPEKLGPYLGLGRTPDDGFNNIARLMCPVARVKIDQHSPPVPLEYYHAGYAFNELLDGEMWNYNDHVVVKPRKLDNLNSDLVYLGDGVLHFAVPGESWNCIHAIHTMEPSVDRFHHPEYRHNGGMNRSGLDFDMGNTANFVFLDGHGETVRYDERFDVKLTAY
jgi:prepilin-type processing-associated H-X9-DG protein